MPVATWFVPDPLEGTEGWQNADRCDRHSQLWPEGAVWSCRADSSLADHQTIRTGADGVTHHPTCRSPQSPQATRSFCVSGSTPATCQVHQLPGPLKLASPSVPRSGFDILLSIVRDNAVMSVNCVSGVIFFFWCYNKWQHRVKVTDTCSAAMYGRAFILLTCFLLLSDLLIFTPHVYFSRKHNLMNNKIQWCFAVNEMPKYASAYLINNWQYNVCLRESQVLAKL